MLGALVTLHEVILSWSNETSRVSQMCESLVDTLVLDGEIEKLGVLYNEYKDRFDEYMNYPLPLRTSLYSPGVESQLEPNIIVWLDRLDKAGHLPKAGPILLFDPQIGPDEYLMAVGQHLSSRVEMGCQRGVSYFISYIWSRENA